ncbi:inositol monophosphatase family protein [Falsiroseomonas sp. HW251]|uniref:inositol monophosphatase family protein n=1 Tax=Falsiroseomonas sp. HW251 TaxID=3390998 RepID=UPI003D321A90
MAVSPRISASMNVLHQAVQKAGRRLLRDFGEVENLQVSSKGPGDFVSQADLRAEQTLKEELAKARPGWAFLGEEGGHAEAASRAEGEWEYRWVVDPLDGTTNFLHGIPQWAVSVGVEKRTEDGRTELVAGCIYNPAMNELFWAEKGAGAFLNDKRIRVSGRREMVNALFSTGIPFAKTQRKVEFSLTLAKLMPLVSGVRRFGSAALDLAWVAAGRYEGFWELGLNKWDVAAGIVLVREAGGMVTDHLGGDGFYDSGWIVAGNPTLQPKLREVVAEGIAAAEAARGKGGE